MNFFQAFIALGIDVRAVRETQAHIAADQRTNNATIIRLLNSLHDLVVKFQLRQEKWNMDVKTALANLQTQVTELITDEAANQQAVSAELTAVESALTALAASGTPVDPTAIQAIADQVAGANTNLKASTQTLVDETAKINAALPPPIPPAAR